MPPPDPEQYIEIWWGDPALWRWHDSNPLLRVGIALSEAESLKATGRQQALENIQRCDMLICPSYFSARAYKESPISVPLYVVPFGVDPDVFTVTSRRWTRVHTLRYLLGGAAQFRKGTWLGIEAFLKAFDRLQPVALTVWSSVKTPERVELEKEYGGHPKIKFHDDHVANPMEIYKHHHVLVSPHLSEGFGLMIPEAMATGMPCIVSRCSSPLEFFSDAYGWWIDMSEDYVPVARCLSNTAGFWRLPDVDSLADCLRYVNKHRREAATRGMRGAEYVRERLTWRHTVIQMIGHIKEALHG